MGFTAWFSQYVQLLPMQGDKLYLSPLRKGILSVSDALAKHTSKPDGGPAAGGASTYHRLPAPLSSRRA